MDKELIVLILSFIPFLIYLGFLVYKLLWGRRLGIFRNQLYDVLEDSDVKKYQKKSGITKKDLKELCLAVRSLSNNEVQKAYNSPERKFPSNEIKNEKELVSIFIAKKYFDRRKKGVYDEKVEPFSKQKEEEFLNKITEREIK